MNRFNKRWFENQLKAALKAMPSVVVTGARQTGKTTLVLELLSDKNRKYFSFDNLDILDLAKSDPETLTSQYPLTFDEVQRAPEVLHAIKTEIDKNRKNGAFILTGSANLALMNCVSESLAGRTLYLELPPFCPCEWKDVFKNLEPVQDLFSRYFDLNKWPCRKGQWEKWLLKGGMPPALLQKSDKSRTLWFSGYVQTYLERDLRQLSEVSSLPDFQRVMRLAANRTGRILNQSEISRDAALAQPTCHRYFNLLETGYQISRLAPYYTNPTTSIVKAKKLMFNDCGVAAWLAGIDSIAVLVKRNDCGFWLEQAVFQTLQTWRSLDPVNRHIFFWRDRLGNEVDFILEDRGGLVALEIKSGKRVMPSDLKGINAFRKGIKADKKIRGIVLHTGDAKHKIGNNAYALPLGWMFPL
ncbi:MAG: ATP-binding protein [bacterium]